VSLICYVLNISSGFLKTDRGSVCRSITAGLWLKPILIGPTDIDIRAIVFDKIDADTITVGFC
jgi:hypothetical protein